MNDDKYNKILMLLPTEDDKWVVAHAVIEDKEINTLDDCIFELADQDGVKPKMKFPIVLVRDVIKLRQKLIEDILGYLKVELSHNKSLLSHMSYVVKEQINKRFGVDE